MMLSNISIQRKCDEREFFMTMQVLN